MTSSLVGSEMCIRDSPPPSPRWAATQQRPRRIRVTPSAANRAKERAAVSYTHLTLPTICSV
eukprot:4793424-Prorocentrum_lima.AAC.1